MMPVMTVAAVRDKPTDRSMVPLAWLQQAKSRRALRLYHSELVSKQVRALNVVAKGNLEHAHPHVSVQSPVSCLVFLVPFLRLSCPLMRHVSSVPPDCSTRHCPLILNLPRIGIALPIKAAQRYVVQPCSMVVRLAMLAPRVDSGDHKAVPPLAAIGFRPPTLCKCRSCGREVQRGSVLLGLFLLSWHVSFFLIHRLSDQVRLAWW